MQTYQSFNIRSHKRYDKYDDFDNKLILFGPPGVGKTRIARAIAKISNCDFIYISASDICGYRHSEGKDTVIHLKNFVLAEFEKNRKTVIVLVDECDRIGLDFKNETRESEKDALTQLWKIIDELKGDPRVFFIFATNKKEKDFDSRFISRITRKINMESPSNPERVEALERLFKKHHIQTSPALLQELAKETEGFTFRHLKNLTKSIRDEFSANSSVSKSAVFKIVEQIAANKQELEKREKEKDEEEPRRRQIMEEQHSMQKESIVLSKVSIGVGIAGIIANILASR